MVVTVPFSEGLVAADIAHRVIPVSGRAEGRQADQER